MLKTTTWSPAKLHGCLWYTRADDVHEEGGHLVFPDRVGSYTGVSCEPYVKSPAAMELASGYLNGHKAAVLTPSVGIDMGTLGAHVSNTSWTMGIVMKPASGQINKAVAEAEEHEHANMAIGAVAPPGAGTTNYSQVGIKAFNEAWIAFLEESGSRGSFATTGRLYPKHSTAKITCTMEAGSTTVLATKGNVSHLWNEAEFRCAVAEYISAETEVEEVIPSVNKVVLSKPALKSGTGLTCEAVGWKGKTIEVPEWPQITIKANITSGSKVLTNIEVLGGYKLEDIFNKAYIYGEGLQEPVKFTGNTKAGSAVIKEGKSSKLFRISKGSPVTSTTAGAIEPGTVVESVNVNTGEVTLSKPALTEHTGITFEAFWLNTSIVEEVEPEVHQLEVHENATVTKEGVTFKVDRIAQKLDLRTQNFYLEGLGEEPNTVSSLIYAPEKAGEPGSFVVTKALPETASGEAEEVRLFQTAVAKNAVAYNRHVLGTPEPHLVVVSFNNTSKVYKTYIDGQLVWERVASITTAAEEHELEQAIEAEEKAQLALEESGTWVIGYEGETPIFSEEALTVQAALLRLQTELEVGRTINEVLVDPAHFWVGLGFEGHFMEGFFCEGCIGADENQQLAEYVNERYGLSFTISAPSVLATTSPVEFYEPMKAEDFHNVIGINVGGNAHNEWAHVLCQELGVRSERGVKVPWGSADTWPYALGERVPKKFGPFVEEPQTVNAYKWAGKYVGYVRSLASFSPAVRKYSELTMSANAKAKAYELKVTGLPSESSTQGKQLTKMVEEHVLCVGPATNFGRVITNAGVMVEAINFSTGVIKIASFVTTELIKGEKVSLFELRYPPVKENSVNDEGVEAMVKYLEFMAEQIEKWCTPKPYDGSNGTWVKGKGTIEFTNELAGLEDKWISLGGLCGEALKTAKATLALPYEAENEAFRNEILAEALAKGGAGLKAEVKTLLEEQKASNIGSEENAIGFLFPIMRRVWEKTRGFPNVTFTNGSTNQTNQGSLGTTSNYCTVGIPEVKGVKLKVLERGMPTEKQLSESGLLYESYHPYHSGFPEIEVPSKPSYQASLYGIAGLAGAYVGRVLKYLGRGAGETPGAGMRFVLSECGTSVPKPTKQVLFGPQVRGTTTVGIKVITNLKTNEETALTEEQWNEIEYGVGTEGGGLVVKEAKVNYGPILAVNRKSTPESTGKKLPAHSIEVTVAPTVSKENAKGKMTIGYSELYEHVPALEQVLARYMVRMYMAWILNGAAKVEQYILAETSASFVDSSSVKVSAQPIKGSKIVQVSAPEGSAPGNYVRLIPVRNLENDEPVFISIASKILYFEAGTEVVRKNESLTTTLKEAGKPDLPPQSLEVSAAALETSVNGKKVNTPINTKIEERRKTWKFYVMKELTEELSALAGEPEYTAAELPKPVYWGGEFPLAIAPIMGKQMKAAYTLWQKTHDAVWNEESPTPIPAKTAWLTLPTGATASAYNRILKEAVTLRFDQPGLVGVPVTDNPVVVRFTL